MKQKVFFIIFKGAFSCQKLFHTREQAIQNSGLSITTDIRYME